MGNYLYRIIALFLTLLCLPFGLLSLFNWWSQENHVFDSQVKLGIASTVWGMIMLGSLFRGRPPNDKVSFKVFKRAKKKT